MYDKKKKKKTRKAKELIEQVARNIKRLRIKMELSQEQLQESTRLAVSRYESGKYDMTITTISILSKHLNVKPHELLQ